MIFLSLWQPNKPYSAECLHSTSLLPRYYKWWHNSVVWVEEKGSQISSPWYGLTGYRIQDRHNEWTYSCVWYTGLTGKQLILVYGSFSSSKKNLIQVFKANFRGSRLAAKTTLTFNCNQVLNCRHGRNHGGWETAYVAYEYWCTDKQAGQIC